METGPTITLEEGLDLGLVQSSGSVFNINTLYNETEAGTEPGETDTTIAMDTIGGEPIKDFKTISEKMTAIDSNGYVKKLILEEGGGMPITDDFTVFVAFSAYWENENEPFDVTTVRKPLEVDLKDVSILPGLEIAIRTMLVGELSLFLFTHDLMYGEMGIPPRIKPAAQCVFYIKLFRSVLTPKQGKLNLSEPNMFRRVKEKVMFLYSSGLHSSSNLPLAVSLFRQAVVLLHKCRLADENEEKVQEELLKRLYLNLAVCYNKMKQPLKACVACNELNRLNSLWTSSKALFQNAKALRMIGQYDCAEKRLRRAINLKHKKKYDADLNAELQLLLNTRNSCNQNKLFKYMFSGLEREKNNENFKEEVDKLIKNFKENANLCKLTLPPGLNAEEMKYVREACIRENLFFNKMSRNDAMNNPTDDGTTSNSNETSEEAIDHSFVLDKEDEQSSCDLKSEQPELTLDEEIFRQIELMVSSPQIVDLEP